MDGFVIGLAVGLTIFWIFDFIDYHFFDYIMKKRFMPNSNSIIVLDDEDTWSPNGYSLKLSDEEYKRIDDGESINDVIIDKTRLRPL